MPTRKLRILHINLASGGIGHYGALFANALEQRRDIEVLTIFNTALLESEFMQKFVSNINKIVIPTRKTKLVFLLKKIIVDWNPDIIHDTAGSGYAYGILSLVLIKKKIPILVTEHDPRPHLGMGTSFPSRLARFLIQHKANYIFVHGPESQKILIKKGIPPSKLSIIRLGHYAHLFASPYLKKIPKESKTVLFFGSMRPNKGIQLLPSIAEKLYDKHPDVKFIIAGSPKVARDLQKSKWSNELSNLLAEMHQLPYFEIHTGFIPNDAVGTFFQRTSITILPYLDATQSAILMIAMPLGSVVVGTRVGDIPFTIEDGVTGYLANPNIDDIVQTLDKVLSNPLEMEQVRLKAKKWAMEECGWGKIINKSIQTYQGLIAT